GLALRIEETRKARLARRRQLTEHDGGELGGLGAGDAHDADAPAPGGRRRGHDGIGVHAHVPAAKASAAAGVASPGAWVSCAAHTPPEELLCPPTSSPSSTSASSRARWTRPSWRISPP